MTLDHLFERAVALIGAGDVPALDQLLADHPKLVRQRLAAAGPWLRDRIGRALDGFFKDRCGLQIELIDTLLAAGASPRGCPDNALVNGHVVAAGHLVARGAELTLASAVCLGRWDGAHRLVATASGADKQFALVLAALNGKEAAVKWMLEAGADVNRPSADLYSHGTPLHHAVCSGSLATVRALVEAGADPDKCDTAWDGTPLGWAEHYLAERKDAESQRRYGEITEYLRGL
jgi:peptide-methionine (S)-S-oxide reductase